MYKRGTAFRSPDFLYWKEAIYMPKSNCHTHTIFCDGSNTPEEMVTAAIALSFESLGFSVHSPLPFKNGYALKYEKIADYKNEITRLKRKYASEIYISNGIELDSDSISFDTCDFDFTIGSVHQLHFGERIYPVDYKPETLLDCAEKEFAGSFERLAKHYFSLVNKFICNRKPDIVGHIDLIEKFNENCTLFNSKSKTYQSNALEVVDGICDACPEIIFEVNTGAMYRCKRTVPYPQKFILERLKERNMRITITSDAHCTEALDYAFDDCSRLCRSCGYKSAYIITPNGFEERPL